MRKQKQGHLGVKKGTSHGEGERSTTLYEPVTLYADCRLLFLNLTQTRISRKEGTSTEELAPSDWPVALSAEHFLDE